MKFLNSALTIALTVCVASSAGAQDETKKKRNQRGGKQITNQLMGRYKKVEFTAEQKTKVDEITKKFVSDIQAIRKENQALLTPEQRKARAAAMKAARAEGKKWKDIQTDVNEASKIDESVMAKMKELQQKTQATQKSAREAIEAVLTDEQKSLLPKPRRQAGKGKAKGKRKAGKKSEDKKSEEKKSEEKKSDK